MTIELIFYLIIFLYGLVIGSFLNVCIYRIPKNEDLAKRRSHCMKCSYQLKWYDLVPLVSWLCLGGRCRICKEKISIQYPIIELVNGVLYCVVFLVNGFNFTSVIFCLFTSALIVLSVIDFRTYEIPVGINILILTLGLIRLALDFQNWKTYLIGLFAVSLFLYLIILISKGKAMGGGDMKLMAACGLVLGWQKIILAFVIGCFLGSIIHLIRMKVSKENHILALGPYLSLGVWIVMLWGEQMIRIYLNYIGM